MARRLLQTLALLASLLLIEVSLYTWLNSFSIPVIQGDNVPQRTLGAGSPDDDVSTAPMKWWQPLSINASRIWNPLDPTSWCVPQHSPYYAQSFAKRARDVQKVKQVDGLIFCKSPKAASSTGAGISLRISHKVGKRLHNNMSCSVNYTHPFAFYRGHAKASPNNSLLWTVVREPAKRELSYYEFFFLLRKGSNKTGDDDMKDFLATRKGGQFKYIATRFYKNLKKRSPQKAQLLVKTLLQHYNFIAIAERMDESLTALKLLFGLHHHDVVVLSSKVGWDSHTCRRVNKINVTESLQHFIQTNFTLQNIDYLLYEASNLSLDLTIQELGPEKFEEEMREHKRLQALVERECPIQLPCLKNAKSHQSIECYADDSGCGYPCVDRVLNQDAKKQSIDVEAT